MKINVYASIHLQKLPISVRQIILTKTFQMLSGRQNKNSFSKINGARVIILYAMLLHSIAKKIERNI